MTFRLDRRIPGPAGLPLLGSFVYVAGDRLAYFTHLRAKYGNTIAFRIAGRRFLLLADPADAAAVLGPNAAKYQKGVGQREARAVLGDGSLTSEGDTWRDRHVRLASIFRHAEREVTAIERIAAESVEEWKRRREIDVVREVAIVALRVAAVLFLGSDFGRMIASRLVRLFATFERRAMQSLVAGLLLPRATAERMTSLVVTPQRRRLLSALHSIDLRQTVIGAAFQDAPYRALEDETLTLLWVGHDTTAAGMASAVAELSTRPALQRAAATDPQLLMHTIQETLRLHPPVWLIPRFSLDADTLPTCAVERKTDVIISTYLMHRDPDVWSRPDEFDPTRFDRHCANRASYLPFGIGPRSCIGARMALTEIPIVLSTFLRQATFTAVETPTYTTMLTLRPRHLRCHVT